MLGRPLRIDPLFMKACAGSWLICSVCIERTMAISSAISAMCGKRSEISWPDWPCLWKSTNDPRAFKTAPLQLGELLPLGERLRERLAVEPLQLGLGVEALELRRAAGHAEVDDPLGPGREVERLDDPLEPAGLAGRVLAQGLASRAGRRAPGRPGRRRTGRGRPGGSASRR